MLTDVDTMCADAIAKDSSSQLSSLCSCRQALKSNTGILKDYVKQSDDYDSVKEVYDDYLRKKSIWNQRKILEEAKLRATRTKLSCGTMFDYDKCGGEWEKVSADSCGFLDLGYQSTCKYTDQAITNKMNLWVAQNLPPPQKPEPIRPGQLALANVMCCDQDFSNIQGDQVKFNNLIQTCQFNVSQKLSQAIKDSMTPGPTLPQLPLNYISPPPELMTKSPTPQPVKQDDDEKSYFAENKSWLIPVIVLIAIAVFVSGYYAFRKQTAANVSIQ